MVSHLKIGKNEIEVACCPNADEIMSLLHDLGAAIYFKNVCFYVYADNRGQVASYVFFARKDEV